MKLFNRKPQGATLPWIVLGRVPDSEETVVVARFDQGAAAKKFLFSLVGPNLPPEEKADWSLRNLLTGQTYNFKTPQN